MPIHILIDKFLYFYFCNSYVDDDNWVKFVTEGMRDGSVKLVLATKRSGTAAVVIKAALPPGCEPEKPVTLRLELSESRESVSALIDRRMCLQCVGSTEVGFLRNGSGLQVGIGSHGGDGSRQAIFKRFIAYSIADGRGRLGPPENFS